MIQFRFQSTMTELLHYSFNNEEFINFVYEVASRVMVKYQEAYRIRLFNLLAVVLKDSFILEKLRDWLTK